MAKIKISDLAFELGCEGKELISFLQEKGIEAKRSNSSIEEADADVARKHFGKAKAKAEKPAKAEKELGWKATESLEDTLRSAWNWQQKLEEKNLTNTNG